MNKFYVYAHYKPNSDIPFYIGKGRDKRINEKGGRNRHWHNTVNKHGWENIRREKEVENLSELDALWSENMNIIGWGRADLGEGPLVNWTDGGEGNSGYIFSEETKRKISIGRKAFFKTAAGKECIRKTSLKNMGHTFNRGKHHTEEQNHNHAIKMKEIMTGRHPSAKTKHKISIAHKGKPKSKESIRKMILTKTGKPWSEAQRNACKPWSKERKRKQSLRQKAFHESGAGIEWSHNQSLKLKAFFATDAGKEQIRIYSIKMKGRKNPINSLKKKEYWKQRKLKEMK